MDYLGAKMSDGKINYLHKVVAQKWLAAAYVEEDDWSHALEYILDLIELQFVVGKLGAITVKLPYQTGLAP